MTCTLSRVLLNWPHSYYLELLQFSFWEKPLIFFYICFVAISLSSFDKEKQPKNIVPWKEDCNDLCIEFSCFSSFFHMAVVQDAGILSFVEYIFCSLGTDSVHSSDCSKSFTFLWLEVNFAVYFHHHCTRIIFPSCLALLVVVMMATKAGPAGEREDSGVEVRIIGDPIVSIVLS